MKKFTGALFLTLVCVAIASAMPPQVSSLLCDQPPQVATSLTECVCGPDCPKGGCENCDCGKFVAVVSRGQATCANGSCGVASALTATYSSGPVRLPFPAYTGSFQAGSSGSCAGGSCGSSGAAISARRTLFGFRRR